MMNGPGDARPSIDDLVRDLTAEVSGNTAELASLRERMVGDIRRLETLHSGVIREVDNARNSHDQMHSLEKEHMNIAREAQEHRNTGLNDAAIAQLARDQRFAQKETVEAAYAAIRRQIDDNGTRIRELELSARSSSGGRDGAVDFRETGLKYAMATLAVIAIIVTILIANYTGA